MTLRKSKITGDAFANTEPMPIKAPDIVVERAKDRVKVTLLAGTRNEHESGNAIIACNDWLRMGLSRSLAGLQRLYKRLANDNLSSQVPTLSLQQLRNWSADYGWASRSEIYDATFEVSKNEAARVALGNGLSLTHSRVLKLKSLADLLEQELKTNLWVKDVKVVGFGKYAERVDLKRFNHPLVEQYRGVLTDLAQEVGGRVRRSEIHASGIEGIGGGGMPTTSAFQIPADLIAPSFIESYRAVKSDKYTEFIEFGGRGSTKSSFISFMIVYLIKHNPEIHFVVLRQVANTLRDSVYAQVQWAINELGLQDEFKTTLSPMEIEYLPTHQKIYFRGGDDPGKLKSIKPAFGYIGGLWFEELDQFRGPEAIRKIEQSAIRGGNKAWIFKSFNPPRTSGNWANKYVLIPKASQYQHKADYLSVPKEWLGQVFLDEAEHLRLVNPESYEHEYLGMVNGTGGQVFSNLTIRKIPLAERKQFDRIRNGIDWGYYPDPFAYVRLYYNPSQMKLYIFNEYKANKKSNQTVYNELKSKLGVKDTDLLIADSAEPKSIADFRSYGSKCRGAEKGPDSVVYSMKWLQSLREIVIDPLDCPESVNEFTDYELEQDKDGNYISEYPDANNHFIDAARYGTNLIWRRRGQ